MTPDIVTLKDRLDRAEHALDEAITDRLVNEPWRISAVLGGPRAWPPCGDTTTDVLLQAELEHRFRLRLYGFTAHPRVRPIGLVVDALLRMILTET